MYFLLVCSICLFTLCHINGFQGPFRRLYPTGQSTVLKITDDPGEPLFLTPYIEHGKINEGKNLRLVLSSFC